MKIPAHEMAKAAMAKAVAAKAPPTAYPKAPLPPPSSAVLAKAAKASVAKATAPVAIAKDAAAGKAKATAAMGMFDPRAVPARPVAAKAPPKLPPAPKPTGITWSDGFVVGDAPLGRPAGGGGKMIPAKAGNNRPVSAGGTRRRQVERYSQSYHSIAYLSVS